ncbi:PREDICTED: uncharacterized protein LOC105509271 [Colobus angolensis palliatus]|uniref:uncharacterized protein LOC105509271 n=1 Tax=Colobus angolensis palliatus TaxID=336983 RepID=UPI0005F52603|nr:PREDICTED: uncharacterized protein LOC105509271 [Colobus angolensis palliatus]
MPSSLQSVCHTLWCSVGTTCHSKLGAAVDGTRCGENKVEDVPSPGAQGPICKAEALGPGLDSMIAQGVFSYVSTWAVLLPAQLLPVAWVTDDCDDCPYKQGGCVWARGWAAQGRRAACTKLGSRDLGVWVQEEAARSGLWPCSSIHQSLTGAHPSPPHGPKYKGKYCVGERKRFRLCNLQACPAGRPSFRHIQCSHFDVMLYEGQLHTWVPVVNDVNPCELHCRPSNEYFAEKLRDAVVDGTPCYGVRASSDLCINGICKNVGCDFEIDSGAMEDRCGVCHGNGSTCHTVSGTFEEAEGLETSAQQRPFSSPGVGHEQVGQKQQQLETCNSGCEQDRLSFGFCETLRLLGHCQLPTVCTQCCCSCSAQPRRPLSRPSICSGQSSSRVHESMASAPGHPEQVEEGEGPEQVPAAALHKAGSLPEVTQESQLLGKLAEQGCFQAVWGGHTPGRAHPSLGPKQKRFPAPDTGSRPPAQPSQVEETPGALAISKEAKVFNCPRAFMLQLHHCPAKRHRKDSSIPSTKASPGVGLLCNMPVHR